MIRGAIDRNPGAFCASKIKRRYEISHAALPGRFFETGERLPLFGRLGVALERSVRTDHFAKTLRRVANPRVQLYLGAAQNVNRVHHLLRQASSGSCELTRRPGEFLPGIRRIASETGSLSPTASRLVSLRTSNEDVRCGCSGAARKLLSHPPEAQIRDKSPEEGDVFEARRPMYHSRVSSRRTSSHRSTL